jgi:hypothetical protein
MSNHVYQVDELIEELQKHPGDYQVRVDVDGAEVPPDVRVRGSETVML